MATSFANAQVLDKMTPRKGRTSMYDWATLFDGKPRRLVKGQQFDSEVKSFRARLYTEAKKHSVEVITSTVDDNTIDVQAMVKTAETTAAVK